MYKKSFTIKEIKPIEKNKLAKEEFSFRNIEEKTFGSYYEIVALQKKFGKSQYYSKEVPPHMFSGNP